MGNPETQNDRYLPDSPTTPPDVSETSKCEAEISIAPELSRPQNPSVTASLDKDNTKVASSSITKSHDPPKLSVIINIQGNPASPEAGTKNPLFLVSAV